MVRANVDKVIEIVNERLVSDRRLRQHQKLQKFKDVEIMRTGGGEVEAVRKLRFKYKPKRRDEASIRQMIDR